MKKDDLMSARKFKRILWIGNALLGVLFVGAMFILRARFNVASVLGFIILFPFYMMGLSFFVWMLERKGGKPYVDAMEKEADAEEEREARTGGRPSVWGLLLLAAAGLLIAAYSILSQFYCIQEEWTGPASLAAVMPQVVESSTMLLCSLLLLGLVYNVWRGRVFTSANSWLINGVAFTVLVSMLVQAHYWKNTPMMPNRTTFFFYMLLSCCISFFGSLFDIAVRMKKEQDLTV